MKMKLAIVAALALGFAAHAGAQEHPCMGDAARLCADVEPGGGAQMQCLKMHKDELSPACKKKVMQTKVKQMERQELQKQEQSPEPMPPR
jgi:hypothetical protein